MGHNCCSKQNVRRGLWSPEEDEKLINYITSYGHGSWSSVPKLAGLERCGKSCRLRWINYLRPDLKRGSFSAEEERIIIDVHKIIGNKWAQIAKQLPGRTDNEVKNFWNSFIKKKLISQGLDPKTHNFLSPLQNNINNNHQPVSLIQSMISQNYSNIDPNRHESNVSFGFLNPNVLLSSSSKTVFNNRNVLGFEYGVGVDEEETNDRFRKEITETGTISKTTNNEFVEFDESFYGILGLDNSYVDQLAWMHGLLM